MARLTPDTVKALARELYEYEFSDEAAAAVAHMIGAMASYTRRPRDPRPAGTATALRLSDADQRSHPHRRAQVKIPRVFRGTSDGSRRIVEI